MAVVYIGIGSNLGDRTANCERAIQMMEEAGLRITRRSSMIETEPWGVAEQPRFINMAVEAATPLAPHDLLHILSSIERAMGRVKEERWGPRVIDLDIVLYDDLVLSSEELVIPHPLMHERRFVLEPLAEIHPGLVHPVLGKTVHELLQGLKKPS